VGLEMGGPIAARDSGWNRMSKKVR